MSTRVIIGGKVVWQSRGKDPPTRVYEPLVDEPQEPSAPAPRGDWEPFTDPHDGVTYRVVQALVPREQWVTLATLRAWYDLASASLASWCVDGLLDAAVVRGSPTARWYRVLNPHRAQQRAQTDRVARAAGAAVPRPGGAPRKRAVMVKLGVR